MERKVAFAGAAVLVAVVLVTGVTADAPPSSGTVVSVYDGDTITVRDAAGREHKCRLLGIDTPEMNYSRLWAEMEKVSKYSPLPARREMLLARKPFRKYATVCERHARRARDELARIVRGKAVSLAYDREGKKRDQYGRLLVYVSLGQTDINAEMVKRGLAVADTRFAADRLHAYVALWRTAQSSRAGIWTDGRETPFPLAAAGPQEFVASRNSKVYHWPSCASATKIHAGNLARFPSTRAAAASGRRPCKSCCPPQR